MINYILAIGSFQALFFALLLLVKKTKSPADYYLFAYFLVFSLKLLTVHYFVTSRYLQHPHILGIGNPLLFLPGPLFYLYCKALMGDSGLKPIRYLLHFFPFIVYTIIYVPYFLQSASEKLYYDSRYPLIGVEWFEKLASILKAVSLFTYHYLIIRTIERHRQEMLNMYSTARDSLLWIKRASVLNIVLIVLGIAFSVEYFFGSYSSENLSIRVDPTMATLAAGLFFSVYILAIGYFGYGQTLIAATGGEQQTASHSKKYARSGLTKEKILSMKHQIVEKVEIQKLYLNSELSVSDLSELVSIPKHQISEILNTGLNVNFYDFINRYRVEEAKKLLSSKKYENYTLETIGFESGFNSRSSFYSYFNKAVGVTPLEYQKQAKRKRVLSD